MRHSLTAKSRWIASLLCVVALVSGCQADKDGQRELLINELRLHEDTIYDQEADLEELERRLDAARRENTILKQEIATLQTQIPQPKKENSLDRLKNKIFGDPVLNPSQSPPDTPLTDAPPHTGNEPPPKIDIHLEPNGSGKDPMPLRDSSPQLAPPPQDQTTPGKKLNFVKPTSHRTTSFKPTLFESEANKANESVASKGSIEELQAYFSKKPARRRELDDATAMVQNEPLKYRRAIQNDAPPMQSDAAPDNFAPAEAPPMMRSVMQDSSVMQNNSAMQNSNAAQNHDSFQNPQRNPREPQRLPLDRNSNQRPLQPAQKQQSQQQQFQQQRYAQQTQPNRAAPQHPAQQRNTRASHNQNAGQVAGSIPAPLDAALGNLPPAIKAPAQAVHHITINPRLTGGHNADRKPGDEGIMVVFSPQDDQNRQLLVQGDVSVVLLDTKLQARSARWDFTADEAIRFFRRTPIGGEAYHFELRWPNLPPPNPQQEVFIRFTTGTGQKFEASRKFLVEGRIEGEAPSIASQNFPGNAPLQPTPGAPPSAPLGSDVAPPAFNINIPEVAQPVQLTPGADWAHSGSASRDRHSRRSGIGQRFIGSRSARSSSSPSGASSAGDPNSDSLDLQVEGVPNGSASNQPLYANGVRNNSSSSSGSTWWNPMTWFSSSGKSASNSSNAQSNAPIYQNGNSLAPQSGYAIVPLDGNPAPNTNASGPAIANSTMNNNVSTGNSTNDSFAPRWSGNAPSATMSPSNNSFQSPQMAEKPEWRPYR